MEALAPDLEPVSPWRFAQRGGLTHNSLRGDVSVMAELKTKTCRYTSTSTTSWQKDPLLWCLEGARECYLKYLDVSASSVGWLGSFCVLWWRGHTDMVRGTDTKSHHRAHSCLNVSPRTDSNVGRLPLRWYSLFFGPLDEWPGLGLFGCLFFATHSHVSDEYKYFLSPIQPDTHN